MNVRIPTTQDPLRVAVLISGGGRTLVNLHEQIQAQFLPARITTVVSSRGDVKGVGRARDLALPTTILERRSLGDEAFQQKLSTLVSDAELVCMAGFSCFWRIPNERIGHVINIHPALLPRYGGKGMYGMRVHEAVLAGGERFSGCTVHLCDNEYDHGPIICQRKIEIHQDETPQSLAGRVFAEECIAYPEALKAFCEGRVTTS